MKLTASLVALWVVLPALRADMVTLKDRDHTSINGTVGTMTKGELTFVARYGSGTELMHLKLADIEIIEFSDLDFNPREPSKTAVGLGPSLPALPDPQVISKKSEANDVVLLLGGKPQPGCKVTSIDSRFVHCGTTDFERTRILRILLLASQ